MKGSFSEPKPKTADGDWYTFLTLAPTGRDHRPSRSCRRSSPSCSRVNFGTGRVYQLEEFEQTAGGQELTFSKRSQPGFRKRERGPPTERWPRKVQATAASRFLLMAFLHALPFMVIPIFLPIFLFFCDHSVLCCLTAVAACLLQLDHHSPQLNSPEERVINHGTHRQSQLCQTC